MYQKQERNGALIERVRGTLVRYEPAKIERLIELNGLPLPVVPAPVLPEVKLGTIVVKDGNDIERTLVTANPYVSLEKALGEQVRFTRKEENFECGQPYVREQLRFDDMIVGGIYIPEPTERSGKKCCAFLRSDSSKDKRYLFVPEEAYRIGIVLAEAEKALTELTRGRSIAILL